MFENYCDTKGHIYCSLLRSSEISRNSLWILSISNYRMAFRNAEQPSPLCWHSLSTERKVLNKYMHTVIAYSEKCKTCPSNNEGRWQSWIVVCMRDTMQIQGRECADDNDWEILLLQKCTVNTVQNYPNNIWESFHTELPECSASTVEPWTPFNPINKNVWKN